MALRALGLVFGGACFSLPSRRWPAQFFRATKGDEDASGDRVFSAYVLRVFNRAVFPNRSRLRKHTENRTEPRPPGSDALR